MYTYRLRLSNGQDTRSRNIVMFDTLEDAYDDASPEEKENNPIWYWQGTFEGVDIANAISRGIRVQVYYSDQVLKNLDQDGSAHLRNLTDTAIWQPLTADTDKSKVKTIAFDLTTKTDGTPFVLDKGLSMYVGINMRAPINVKERLNPVDHAYNRAVNQVQLVNVDTDESETSVEKANTVKVKLWETDVL